MFAGRSHRLAIRRRECACVDANLSHRLFWATFLDALLGPTGRDGYKLVSFLKSKGKFRMKRIAVLTLLVALSVAWSIPAKAQHMSVAESARQSRKADKKQQKMNRKAAKKQQKATKKYEKAQRKAAKKANHRAKRTS